MTVINGIEIDIVYNVSTPKVQEIHGAIVTAMQSTPLHENEKLHVIIVISNPCQYARRYILAREFILRYSEFDDILLYVVELAYDQQQFYVTDRHNPRHLQLRANTSTSPPLWHKENMINIGVRTLLPKDYKAVAWVDADIEFDNPHWARDTLHILTTGACDIVQLFSHALDLDAAENPMQIFSGFGYQYSNGRPYSKKPGIHFFHPGYAWACTRAAYEQMGGIFELSVLGSGDHNMALSFIGHGTTSLNTLTTDDYKQSIAEFQQRCVDLKLGYVPGVIKHYFHGTKKNRKYTERWQILVHHAFSPREHLTHDWSNHGLLIPSSTCPRGLVDDILRYFEERNEDDGFTSHCSHENVLGLDADASRGMQYPSPT